jgi:periplasmic protein TonB
VTGRQEQPAKREPIVGRPLFCAELPTDDGPSARATVISLALHVSCVAALALWIHFSVPVSIRPYQVTILHETRLVDPVLPLAGAPRATAGGGTGSRRPSPASHGATPPRSDVHTVFPSLVITTPRPKLPVSPTLLEVAAPKIEENFRYGDPASALLPVSAGTGLAGIGSGQFPTAALGTNTGSGRKQSASSGAVFSLKQVSVAPLLVYKVDPDYSDQARLARYNGTVLLRLIIDEKGDPRDIHVLRSLGLGLDEKAIEAVRRWRFRPGLKDGKAVAVDANIEVNFQLL